MASFNSIDMLCVSSSYAALRMHKRSTRYPGAGEWIASRSCTIHGQPSSKQPEKGHLQETSTTIWRKADILARETKAQICVVVLHRGQYFVYTSHENATWPPTREQIATSFPPPNISELRERSDEL